MTPMPKLLRAFLPPFYVGYVKHTAAYKCIVNAPAVPTHILTRKLQVIFLSHPSFLSFWRVTEGSDRTLTTTFGRNFSFELTISGELP